MVKGIAQFNRKLTTVIPAKVEAVTRKAMETGADELVAMMKRLVPVDHGDLRDSIAWKWGNAPKGATVLAESKESRGLKITIYATDFKARWIEFGTIKMSAKPYFFPSYRALRKRIKSRITREMKKAIQAESASE
jgi:HK97 gp10 family phage protein